ncbi:TRAP transporter large permease [Limimaricola hongkongensis]|uniref:TRAP transporter large permease protein n=1 Tax=Limimaricola hongkongensis DSM 17492 TaxID=1122180 RepID=A0A017HAK9_9RHOB|nr:TRAP transporter large permease [Limimaricola hongkongensis]EYD71411.1 TRAP-type C4-dicarboxylate transport system [Limimaricola hongkongensis DSM 17492]
MTALLFGTLMIFLVIGVPVTFALGLAAVATIWQGDLMPLLIVPQEMIRATNSFPLLAIPFFILAGFLMQQGGISRRLVDLSNALVGQMTGGLAMVAIVTSLFFAAISGSGTATTAAVGSILIPAMVAKGYDRPYAASNQAASGALGVIIPPSIPLILYAVAANQSVGDMFIAGIMPGIVVTISLLIYAYFYARSHPHVQTETVGRGDLLLALRRGLLAILMPILVLGGIYGGVFTPTEAAVVAVVYAFVVGVIVYRELGVTELPKIFRDSAITSAVVLSIIAAAGLYGRVILSLQIPLRLSEFTIGTIESWVVFIVLVNLLLLVVGMFLEAAAAILIFTPILLPIAIKFGFDPIHFGIIMVVNLAMGMFTPPVGLNLFVASQISGSNVTQMTRRILPFVVIVFVNVLILSFAPIFSMGFLK